MAFSMMNTMLKNAELTLDKVLSCSVISDELLGQVLKISQTAPQTFFFKKDQAVDVLRVLVMEGLNNSDSSLGFKQTVVEIIGLLYPSPLANMRQVILHEFATDLSV